MKKFLLYSLLFSFSSLFIAGCSEDDDFHPTIYNVKEEIKTSLDEWIWENYTEPFNMEIIYRWNDFEANANYELVPPKEDRVQLLLRIFKKIWVEPYLNSAAGPNFFRRMSPKQLMFVGSVGYNPEGTYLRGEAGGGNKIAIYGLNTSDMTNTNVLDVYIHDMHHEFVHVLHQTEEYSEAFELISAADYTASWTSISNPNRIGFISSYAAEDPDEDFAEMISYFILRDATTWENHMAAGGFTAGSEKLREKEKIILNYMKNVWNIDLYQVREDVRKAKEQVLLGNF